ncbi:MAG: hypothetical protein ACT4OU_13480 [Hyphomicrobium sp.]
MKRLATATALSLLVLLAPSQSDAQLHEFVKACKRSVGYYFACLVVSEGIEQGIEVTVKSLYDRILNNTPTFQGDVKTLEPGEFEKIESPSIEWADLKNFLLSVFTSKAPVDDAQARKILEASCQSKISPICAQLVFTDPAPGVTDCSASSAQRDCETKMTCSWNGSSCVRAGTKELLKDLSR